MTHQPSTAQLESASPVPQPSARRALQRACACGKNTAGGGACGACSREGMKLRRRAAGALQEPAGVPESVNEVLGSTGSPLDAQTRAFMESRFGQDFSRVRVHTGARAAESARDVNALAYTVGSDVVFGAGRFAPNTGEGRRLIAHELAHTIQQSGDTSSSSGPLSVSEPGDFHEREADAAADRVAASSHGEGDASGARRIVSRAPLVSNTAARKQIAKAPLAGPDKYSAQSALLDWKEKADAFLHGTRAWLAANWTAYLGMTSSNPSLGWQESGIYGVASNAFGNAVNEAATAAFKYYLKKSAVKAGAGAAGAAVGGLVGNVPGAIIGFVIGVLIESVAGVIFDAITGKSEIDTAVTQASRATSQLIESKTAGFDKEAERAKRALDSDFRQQQTALTGTESQEQVDAVRKWAEGEAALIKTPPNLDDRSLYTAMIREWVLEHAGDEEDPNKATSAAQWRYALKVGKDPSEANKERGALGLPNLPQALPSGEDLDNHPEIFAYQTRGHWQEAGLPLQDEAQKLVKKVPDILAQNPQKPAAAVMAFFDGKSFSLTKTPRPQLLIRLINNEATDFVLVEEQKQQIERGEFALFCSLDLAESDGSVYVDEWDYTIYFAGQLPEHTCAKNPRNGREVCGNPVRKLEFSVSPD